jgi:hypothetical protein
MLLASDHGMRRVEMSLLPWVSDSGHDPIDLTFA